ncbi:MAG: hypothetical protein LBR61_06945 [Synergistaceae bacterium]|jgi:uncharacterized membrane protein YkvI|nr:hypothetical protein [Synergistaceae bacterium]
MSGKISKSLVPGYLGLAAVWFGIHCGPGTASGKQTSVYFLEYGKWSLIMPFFAMGFLGLAVYYAAEFSRRTNSTNFKDFANKLFYPYDKFFANFFEFTFLATVGMSGGSCMATGSLLFYQYFGLPVVLGIALMSAVTIIFSIYGAELVRASSSYMSFIIFLCMVILVGIGIMNNGGISNSLNKAVFAESELKMSVWQAIVYPAFQSTGVIGGIVTVADSLRNKGDSKRAACWGIAINALFLVIIAVMLMGYPEAPKQPLPNYYVITQIGLSFLTIIYVLIVFLACVTNTIAFSHAMCGRYGQFLKINNLTAKNLLISVIMLIYLSAVSWFGLDAIVRTGFTYLGYAALFTLLVPTIFVGAYKLSKMPPEKN